MIRTGVVQRFGSRVCQSEAPINNVGLHRYKHNKVFWVSIEWQPQARALAIHYFIFSQHSWAGGSIITSIPLTDQETEAQIG